MTLIKNTIVPLIAFKCSCIRRQQLVLVDLCTTGISRVEEKYYLSIVIFSSDLPIKNYPFCLFEGFRYNIGMNTSSLLFSNDSCNLFLRRRIFISNSQFLSIFLINVFLIIFTVEWGDIKKEAVFTA